MITILTAVANHVHHLNKLTLHIKSGYHTNVPDAFFQLRFPELQELDLQGYHFHFAQWPLLHGFLEGHGQLTNVSVKLNVMNDEEALRMWTLFPLTLDRIHLHIHKGIHFEVLPIYVGESYWRSLTITTTVICDSLDIQFEDTALYIQELAVNDLGKNMAQLEEYYEEWLADNRKRHLTLQALAAPQDPSWCQPNWED